MRAAIVPLAATTLSMIAGSLLLLAAACGDDEAATTPTPSTNDAGTSSSPDSGNGTPGEDSGGSGKPDTGGAPDADTCVGQFAPPVLNGGGPCGTGGFGEPAAMFGPVDVDGGTEYVGTDLPNGIYDAVIAERASGNAGSWRETFVVQGNRFTRIRQIDTGTSGGLGPITYRSGTFSYVVGGQSIQLTYDCAQSGDAGVDAGMDTLPSDAITSTDCKARYRYGASGIRVTLRRR